MILYRLGLKKLIEYFKLDQLFKEDERKLMLLHKKPKEIYRTKLKADRTMDLCISMLLSLIGALICISIPYAVLESPCEALKARGMTRLYNIAKYLERYVKMIDRLIIALSIILVYVTVNTIVDAIQNTNISMSPWLERGKYTLPEKLQKKMAQKSLRSKVKNKF